MSVTVNGYVIGTVTDFTAFFNTILPIIGLALIVMLLVQIIRAFRR